jgi:hypothetical protein
VQKILTRPAYLGISAWNRQHQGKYHEITGGEFHKAASKHGRRRKDAGDWVVVEGTHDPLVDRSVFDRVAHRLVERRRRCSRVKTSAVYLLAGLLKCGHCGRPMHGCSARYSSLTGDDRRYPRYICGSYNLNGAGGKNGCRCNTVKERPLAEFVVATILDRFLSAANVAALRAEIRRQEEAERSGRDAPAANVDRQIAELERKLAADADRWLDAPPSLSAEIGEAIERRRAKLEALQAHRRTLAKPAASVADLDAAVDKIAKRLGKLRGRVYDVDPRTMRTLFRDVVEGVDLFFRDRPYGAKNRGVLEHGEIRLHPELVCGAVVGHVGTGFPSGTCPTTLLHPALDALRTFRFTAADLGIVDAAETRRDAIVDALRATPALSDRAVGRRLGVSGVTVGRVRRSLNRTAKAG